MSATAPAISANQAARDTLRFVACGTALSETDAFAVSVSDFGR
ncbi:hypothetical protein [Tessaracoccus sp. MC1627]|nr:hypothetical protein [Tessaracoccus sp. MC1627]